MSRLLILGVSPLPFEVANRSFGPGTRTWQLTDPLLADGHTVRLIAGRIPETYPDDAKEEIVISRDRLEYASISGRLYFETPYVRHSHDEFNPDAVIFAHGSASFIPSLLEPVCPVWIDFNGHVMAEAQAVAAVYQKDWYLDYFFDRVLPALFCGDYFSTVSEAQAFALIGELGLAGRLNAKTNGVQLVHTIPNGLEEAHYRHDRKVLRGVDVDDDAFVVLWSGGFNTWTDIDTMFAGLEYAMVRDASIHFVSTGGQIDGHDEMTYPRFVEMVEGSVNRPRYFLKGWLPSDLVHNYYFEADVGINCEKDIYEVRLGSKNRILDWSRAALPTVTTRVTELSMAIEEDGVGFVHAPSDPAALGEAILEAARRRHELPTLGVRCRQALERRYGLRTSRKALCAWAASPQFAPDHDRSPTCLEAILNQPGNRPAPAQAAPADSNEAPPMKKPDSVPSKRWTSRAFWTWVFQATTKAYRDGGPTMIVRRAWNHLNR